MDFDIYVSMDLSRHVIESLDLKYDSSVMLIPAIDKQHSR